MRLSAANFQRRLDTQSQQPVELRYLVSPDVAARSTLLAEARAIERLDIPGLQGILKLLDQDPLVLVLPVPAGIPSLEKAPGSEAELLRIALDVAQILDKLHSRGIVHRDLRPENLLLQEDGSVALQGWGWDELLAERHGTGPKRGAEAMDFLAPEASQKAISRSDLYSLGMTLIHLGTGKHPAELYDPSTRSYLWQDSSKLSPEFTLLIDTLIQTKSGDRLASSKILIQRLQELMQSGEGQAAPAPPQRGAPVRAHRNRDRRLWLLLLLLFLLWPLKAEPALLRPWTWRILLAPLLEARPPHANVHPSCVGSKKGKKKIASASAVVRLDSHEFGSSLLPTPDVVSSRPSRPSASTPGSTSGGANLWPSWPRLISSPSPPVPPSVAPRRHEPTIPQPGKPASTDQGDGVELRVSASQHTLTLYRDDRVQMSFPVGLGASGSTPIGSFFIKNKASFPDYQSPDGRIVSGHDPNNPLGTRWLGLTVKGRRGIGIHGTNEPDSIGDNLSLGCIRLRNSDMEMLYQAMPAHAWVMIEP